MGSLSDIISINPIRPSSGPLSKAIGAGMAIQSLAGMRDPQMGFMYVSEALQSIQDQIDVVYRLLGVNPTVQAINFPFLSITGLTFTNNSPSAGNIAWTACTVWYNGQAYGISAGNTSAGEKLVWWVVGETSFRFGNSFTPNITTFDIATNVGGTADNNWSKIGANGIQSSQVLGGLLFGYQIQTPATASVSAGITVTLISYSGAGALLGVGVAWNLSTSAGGGAVLSVNVDGSGAQTFQITTPNNPNPDPVAVSWGLNSSTSATISGNSGLMSYFGIPFNSSIVVQLQVANYVSGSIQAAAGWAKKL